MRTNHRPIHARLLFLCAVPAALCALARPAEACDPGQVKFSVRQPPRSGNVPLIYQLNSLCRSPQPRCQGQTPNVTGSTTIQQKCHMLVDSINTNASCGSSEAGFLVENVNCDAATAPSFTVRDPNCPAGTENTFYFSIANYIDLLKPNTNQSGFLFGDYELDIITPDCPSWGAGQANLFDGVGTGVPINAGSPAASMSAVLDLSPIGGPLVFASANTTLNETAEQVTAAVLSQLKIGLVGTGVTCDLPAGQNRVISCTAPDGTHGIGVGVQADDTGFVRGVVTGPPAAVTQLVAKVDSPSAPPFNQVTLNVGPTVPAAGSWALAALGALVAAAGVVSLARRRSRGVSG
jgi:hypothetical protein